MQINAIVTLAYKLIQFMLQVMSHKRAAAATASGKFKDEIIPVSTKVNIFFCICEYISES